MSATRIVFADQLQPGDVILGHIRQVVDLPDTPGGRALWHHLVATLRTVTTEETP